MVASITEFLDDLYTTTWYNTRDSAADQVFNSMPLWAWFKAGNRMRAVRGGTRIQEPLQIAATDNINWTGKGGTVSLVGFEHLTDAYFEWRYLVGSIVRFWTDDQKNAGQNQIMNLMNSRMDNLKNALANEMETRLASGSGAVTGSGTLIEFPAFDGLQTLVADDPTASVLVGNINQSTETLWRNKQVSMAGKSFATYGVSYLRTLINDCSNNLNSDKPDVLFGAQAPYESYEDSILPYYRTYSNKLADLGFEVLQFKGLPFMWTPSMSQRIYVLNTNHISFVYDPAYFMEMTEWKAIPNQIQDRAAQILTACQFTTNRRRCQGVMHHIDTP